LPAANQKAMFKKRSVIDHTDLVHIHDNTSSFTKIVPLKNLYRFLTCNWLFDAAQTGIPVELTEKVYDDYNKVSVHPATPGEINQVCCVSPRADDHLDYILQVIAILNLTNAFSLSVFSAHPELHSLQQYGNENVSFLQPGINQFSAGIIITYGPGALHFIKAKIPVIILGPYGFGGLVTTTNFNWFIENGFMGRPMGGRGEPVPASIVLDELIECKEKQASFFSSDQLSQLANGILCKPLSEASSFVQVARKLHEQLYDPHLRWQLKPVVASNIALIPKEGNIYIRRLRLNTTLAVLKKKDQVFFQQMNGQNTCMQLMNNTSLSNDDFWSYLYMLWEQKIILFHAV
jgi:hypothetical protein